MLQDDTEELLRNTKTRNVDDVFHDENNDDPDTSEQTRLLPSTTISVAASSMPRPLTSQHAPDVVPNVSDTYKNDSKLYEEMVLRVERPAGATLGISIAGGAGSTPYRTNDQVCLHALSSALLWLASCYRLTMGHFFLH